MTLNNKNLPATKGDLEKFATKNDLNKLEQKLTGKIDSVETRVVNLENITKNIAIDLTKTQTDIRDMKETMATTMATKDDINRIMNAIDVFAGEAKDYRRKDADRGHTLMEHHDKLEDHESRVTALEAKK